MKFCFLLGHLVGLYTHFSTIHVVMQYDLSLVTYSHVGTDKHGVSSEITFFLHDTGT